MAGNAGRSSCPLCQDRNIPLHQRRNSPCSVHHEFVRDGICVDPLCRGTSQGKCGSWTIGLVCDGETVGKIGEVRQDDSALDLDKIRG